MSTQENILISLEPRHAENILSGRKRVELRRRPMNVATGSIVWIYAKLPVGSVVGRVQVKDMCSKSPQSLWRQFGENSGLTRKEFFAYFEGVTLGVALRLTKPERLRASISLGCLRKALGDFHPPQFFARLGAGHPMLRAQVA